MPSPTRPVIPGTQGLAQLFLKGFLTERDVSADGTVDENVRRMAEIDCDRVEHVMFRSRASRRRRLRERSLLHPIRPLEAEMTSDRTFGHVPSLPNHRLESVLPLSPDGVHILLPDESDATTATPSASSAPTVHNLSCAVCTCNVRDIVCIPCGHFVLCHTCLFRRVDDRCPICRADVTFMKVFLS